MDIVQLIANTMNGQHGQIVHFRVEEVLKLEAETSKPTICIKESHVTETGLKK
jgi:hypothetical protein